MTTYRGCLECRNELSWGLSKVGHEVPFCAVHGERNRWGVFDASGKCLHVGTLNDDHEHLAKRRAILLESTAGGMDEGRRR
ncbi:MAG: hypothetical protein A2133_00870 [Actinobacteria bacterium RBG_16_64_13]|nr:MAG: hypothetical protein A2133_00870 [Actinobacteria bacterium RBG_16_64_13]